MDFPNSVFASEADYLKWRINRRSQRLRDSQGEVDEHRAARLMAADRDRLKALREAQPTGRE